MNRSHVKVLVVTATAAAEACATLLTSAVAAAAPSPDMTGKTFSDAQTALKQAGFTAVVANTFGDKLAQGDCKVIAQRDVPSGLTGWSTSNTTNGIFTGGDQPTLYPGPGFGDIPATGRVMLTLACYGAKDPGPSRPTGSGDINTKKSQ
jgi:PASTA domain-containing protein